MSESILNYVCVMGQYATILLWMSEGNIVGLGLYFYMVSRNQTQLIRLIWQGLYLCMFLL